MNLIPIKEEKQTINGKETIVYLIPAISFNTPNGKTKKVPHPSGNEAIVADTLDEAKAVVERSGYTYATKKLSEPAKISSGLYDYNQLIYETLTKLTTDEVSNVESSALQALGEIKNPASVSLFIQKMGEDSDIIRNSAIDSLKKYGTTVLPEIIEALKDENWVRRNSAIICIGEIAKISSKNIETTILPLVEASKDLNTIVKASSAKVLGIVYTSMNTQNPCI